MSRRSSWNEEEQLALYGLSLLARVVYLQVLRWRMDYATGIVGGPGRRLSYMAIAETVDFIPDKGSNVSPDKPSKGRLRAVLRELVRSGLIEDAGSSKQAGLVLRCLLADTDQSAKNMNDTGTTQERHSRNSTGSSNNNNNLGQRNDTGTTQHFSSMSATPPISGLSENNSVAAEYIYPRACVDQRNGIYAALHKYFSNYQSQLSMPALERMVDNWVEQGVHGQHVERAVLSIRQRAAGFSCGPMYIRDAVIDVMHGKNISGRVPEWASVPADDRKLWDWAKRHKYSGPGTMTNAQYRAVLRTEVEQRRRREELN
ncbi:MAG: hypothetical protein JAY88_14660 [Candidatus Thiodiazotropha lotti]|nr:hypothetical protein [Candidatus Thiodiazotropha lotti]MCW4188305.1 hypothetical protein [Candidatus Thiodiazotropha lotti]